MSVLEDWRERVVYTIIPNRAVTDLILQECAELFSHHYGKWSSKIEHKNLVPVPGAPIRLKPSKLKTDYLFNNRCGLVTAKVDQQLIGHAFFTIFYMLPNAQFEIRWVTQLVVHANYRHHKVAQNLLLHSLGTQAQGYGLVTSHPHAVRALERAVRHKCFNLDPEGAKRILQQSEIPYLHSTRVEICCDQTRSLINTKFLVDHGEVEKALKKETQRNDDLIELEVRSVLRQNALQREQLISREMESFKNFEGKSITKRRSKLRLELDNVQEQLNELGRSEPLEEQQKKFHQWVIGNDLPDGHEFLAIIFPPPTIQLPPFLPVGAELGVNIFWKIPTESKSEK
jgi:hypothetical protein